MHEERPMPQNDIDDRLRRMPIVRSLRQLTDVNVRAAATFGFPRRRRQGRSHRCVSCSPFAPVVAGLTFDVRVRAIAVKGGWKSCETLLAPKTMRSRSGDPVRYRLSSR